MTTTAVRLLPPGSGPLVFQEGLPRSDTVWGALVWALKELGLAKPEEFIAERLAVSSVFPCGKEGRKPLLPKPLLPPPVGDFRDRGSYRGFKKLKKRRWLTREQFQDVLEGKGLPEKPEEYPSADTKLQERPRVVVPRLGGESNLFHKHEVMLWAAWLALRGDEAWIGKAIAGLRFLGERGLGGGASYGRGCFRVEHMEVPFGDVEDGEACVLLSLYCPKDGEWDSIRNSRLSSYKVVYRKGKMDSSRVRTTNPFKRPVLYLAEGSVLPWMSESPGDNPEVTPHESPGFSVHAQGVALAVRARIEGGEE